MQPFASNVEAKLNDYPGWRFRLKRTFRVVLLLSCACAVLAVLSNFAQAQKIDVAFGISTIVAPGAGACGSNCGNPYAPQSLTGGAYPGVSGDVTFWHNLGVGAEVFWRGTTSQNYLYSEFGPGINFRPVFYNFNAVYSAKVIPHVAIELVGGIGASDTHFSQTSVFGNSGVLSTSSHFDGDFGGGIKLYAHGGFFVRPEARFYFINNETNYSANHATRVGVSVGYTFR
jgi:hypothetical protein